MLKNGLEHPLERGGMGQISVKPVGAYVSGLLKQRGDTADDLVKVTSLSPDLIDALIAGQQILTADVALVLGDRIFARYQIRAYGRSSRTGIVHPGKAGSASATSSLL